MGKKNKKDLNKKSSSFIEGLANLIIKVARPDYEIYKEGLEEKEAEIKAESHE